MLGRPPPAASAATEVAANRATPIPMRADRRTVPLLVEVGGIRRPGLFGSAHRSRRATSLQGRSASACDCRMLLSEVGYARPATLEQALGVMAKYPGARALAGGQTLINVMKARAAAPDVLVDSAGIPELTGIELAADGTLEIGPMTTYSELIASAEARARPILGEVCAQIADVQVRNKGTIGGNVCSRDPAKHLHPLLVALGAAFTITGADGERAVPADDFFLGVYMTAAGPGELLTQITVPAGPTGAGGTCIASAAATGNGGVRVALGCVAATPVVVDAPSADAEAVRGAVGGAGSDPPAGVHASSEYRRHLAGVVAARAVEQAKRGN